MQGILCITVLKLHVEPTKFDAHNAFYVQELLICLGAPMKPVASTSNRQTPICCR